MKKMKALENKKCIQVLTASGEEELGHLVQWAMDVWTFIPTLQKVGVITLVAYIAKRGEQRSKVFFYESPTKEKGEIEVGYTVSECSHQVSPCLRQRGGCKCISPTEDHY
jgi:hypothetical protein